MKNANKLFNYLLFTLFSVNKMENNENELKNSGIKL